MKVFTLENEYICMKVTNIGCRILELFVPDKRGQRRDIILGLAELSDIPDDTAYFGALMGRVCNRTKNAQFTLNGVTYKLAANNGPNHLHGGIKGFDKQEFEATMGDNCISFHRVSPDGEEGYPGNLDLTVDYILDGNTLTIKFLATTDKDTPVSLTNHMYFNLAGQNRSVLDHSLLINAGKVCCVDENIMATGEITEVDGSIFDFRKGKKIGDGIDAGDLQIQNAGGGLDHHFIFDDLPAGTPQVELMSEESGIRVLVKTTAPGAQIYTGNYLSEGCKGKTNAPYDNQTGVAIETQLMPNAINSKDPECVILRKGAEYRAETKYIFGIKK
ncbi:MAG: galactose mutarotase [Lachnospiraceae bacterium]|nr:galactose mutarotase [Lachnospiraceae bacterium]